MKEIWDQRYAQKEYVYGTEPNSFFKEQLLNLQAGKILLPAEGEGRNAVHAALSGWDVTAFDSSSMAIKKADSFAVAKSVKITYHNFSFEEANFPENTFDGIALIYAHAHNRKDNHKKIFKFLKAGGTIILEGFSKNQINNQTGGPQNSGMLFSEKELREDFSMLSDLKIWENDIILDEGKHHKGKASIIRLIGKK